MALRIVTDSTCDLPSELARSLNIAIIPCNVHFGEEVYQDRLDIQPREFYRKLVSTSTTPKTSQPSVGTFVKVYESLAEEADEILSLHISSKLSGTYQSALLARGELKGPVQIEVVDSLQVSLGLGILALESARIAQQGGTLKEAVGFLHQEIPKVQCLCAVATLEYLVRGGRASRFQGFLGSLLNIKPIIEIRDGETHLVERVRSRARAKARLQEFVASQRNPRALGFLHSACPEEAEALATGCSSFFPREAMLISEFSAAMGAHLGPGALGVAFWSSA